MSGISIIARRFAELLEQADAVAATKHLERSDYTGETQEIDRTLLLNWKVKVRNLLGIACGAESEHYRQFEASAQPSMVRTSLGELVELRAVFEAAKEDYDGGYLNSVRNLVQAEVFDSELDQARALLNGGYSSPAAVVAGVVLETALRQLCIDRQIPIGKLDKMNADLAKAGVYNLLKQKQITALADIRNNAAHGHPEQFTDRDVATMIASVESFLADHL